MQKQFLILFTEQPDQSCSTQRPTPIARSNCSEFVSTSSPRSPGANRAAHKRTRERERPREQLEFCSARASRSRAIADRRFSTRLNSYRPHYSLLKLNLIE